jgi:hypothetical protein
MKTIPQAAAITLTTEELLVRQALNCLTKTKVCMLDRAWMVLQAAQRDGNLAALLATRPAVQVTEPDRQTCQRTPNAAPRAARYVQPP